MRLPPLHLALQTDDCQTLLRFAVDAFWGALTALAMLTQFRRGAFRRLGSQMAVRADGGIRGYVSGGCTEAEIVAG